nr:metallothionein [Synechococcus sp. A15-60]
MSTALRCACSKCVCEVEPSTAVVRDGQHFCSDACATGHPNRSLVMALVHVDASAQIEASVPLYQCPFIASTLRSQGSNRCHRASCLGLATSSLLKLPRGHRL